MTQPAGATMCQHRLCMLGVRVGTTIDGRRSGTGDVE